MAIERDTNAEALARGAEPGQGYALGRILSNIFHPVVLSIATFIIIGCYSGPTLLEGLGWALLCILLQILPGTFFFIWRLKKGNYSDEDVSQRHQRNELYLFTIICGGLSILVIWLLGMPTLFMAAQISAFALSLSSWIINMFWKISVHAATNASCATVALLLAPMLGVVLWICTLLVGWARIRTRNHTPSQVLAGMLLAALCIVVTFRAFGFS